MIYKPSVRSFDTMGKFVEHFQSNFEQSEERVHAEHVRAAEKAREIALDERAFEALEEKLVEEEMQKIRQKYRPE